MESESELPGFFDGLIEEFEKKYPGATVKWVDQPADGYSEKLSADAAAGTLPDVINLDPGTGYPLAQAGRLLNLAAADPDAKTDFLPQAWSSMEWKALDGNYGYPWYLSTGPSLYNTALFTQAGLDPENLPITFDELFDQTEKMAAVANGGYAMLASPPVIETFGMYGVEPMNADQTEFTFNSAKGVELVQKYKDAYEKGGLLPDALRTNYTGVDQSFQAGKVAYMPGSAYNVKAISEDAPNVYETLKLSPIITNTKPNMYIQLIGISQDSKNKPTAAAFAKFVTNAENQLGFAKEVNIFPSTVGTIDDPHFTTEDSTDETAVRVLSAEQIKTAVVYSPASFTGPMKDELRDQIALALQGEKTPQEALDAAVAYANERLTK